MQLLSAHHVLGDSEKCILDYIVGMTKKSNQNESIKAIKKEISQKNVCFLLGNGINNQFGKAKDWRGLMKQIAVEQRYPYEDIESLLPTEQYSALVIQYGEKVIRDKAIELINSQLEVDYGRYAEFNNKLEELNCPVLTTNIDSFLHKEGSKERSFDNDNAQGKGNHKSVKTIYKCWSTKDLQRSNDGYGIWHLNGYSGDKETVRFGLIDYVKLCTRLSKPIQDVRQGKAESLLAPFFNYKLCIIGLCLDEAEFLIRWLLLTKAHMATKKATNHTLGWYLYANTDNDSKLGKDIRFNTLQFLQTVGIVPVEFEKYDDLYLSLFNVK